MNIYKDLGFLILGSRLRRLSEYYLAEVNKVYAASGIAFEASWFPVFFILARDKPVSLKALAEELEVSHSAVSQLIKNLKTKELVTVVVSEEDRRHQLVVLSTTGKSLLKELAPIWEGIAASLPSIKESGKEATHFLSALEHLEKQFALQSLSESILEKIK